MVDLLAEDFLSEEANRLMTSKDKIAAFSWVLAGGEFGLCPELEMKSVINQKTNNVIAAGMSIVGAFA